MIKQKYHNHCTLAAFLPKMGFKRLQAKQFGQKGRRKEQVRKEGGRRLNNGGFRERQN